jgi:NAD(P)-dependent dehydrogenase (short-subunit alcohol dehydrogenase family)
MTAKVPTSEEPHVIMSGRLLDGRSAIITGGAGAIGRGTARLFAEHGARLAIFDISDEALAATKSELGEHHLYLNVDVRDPVSCKRAVAEVVATFGGLDILVTMAGTVPPGGIADVTVEGYDAVMDNHMRGTFNICQAVVPTLRAQKRGAIVCMSSIAAERGGGLHGGVHYAAAKSGILGFARALARELGPENIRVNAVCPGAVFTGRRDRKETEDRFGSQIPMRRIGTTAEIGGCFLFLASDLAGFVTGATLDANGGMHIA